MPTNKMLVFSMLGLCLLSLVQAQPLRAQTSNNRAISVIPTSTKSSGETFVLLVGINAYPPTIGQLRYCTNDMETLAVSFEKAGIPKNNIILMTDNAKEVFLRPSKSNIEHQLTTMTKLVTNEDQFIFAFSGHGAAIEKESFLCPNDCNPEKPESLISRHWVNETLESCSAKRILFIIDACRNYLTAPGSRTALSGVRSMTNPLGDELSRGFAVLASCTTGQQSWEDEKIGHGVFTYYIAKGIDGAADKNMDGFITLDELYTYAMNETRMHVMKLRNVAQLPTRGGETSGQFVIVQFQNKPRDESVVIVGPPPRDEPHPLQQTRNYTLDLSKTGLGNLPTGWEGSDNIVVGYVQSVNGIKAVTSNLDNTTSEVTLENLFYQPSDCVIQFTAVSKIVSHMRGILIDEDGNTIPFVFNKGGNGHAWSVSIGDARPKDIRQMPRDRSDLGLFTITRTGSSFTLKLTSYENEALAIRSSQFKVLTSIKFIFSDNRGGISQLSIRSL